MARVKPTETATAAPDRNRKAGRYDRATVQRWLERIEELAFEEPARVALLVESPRSGVRRVRPEVTVVAGDGFAGDYERKDFYKGERVPGREVSAVAREVLSVVDAEPADIGDNLVTEGVDLRALRPGDRLEVGEEVVLRRSERPHEPCVPFRERTSPEAFAVVARADVRGALFHAERGGVVRHGDEIRIVRTG